jgi:hypothetical protein
MLLIGQAKTVLGIKALGNTQHLLKNKTIGPKTGEAKQ